jgi:hypothetical protein
MVGPKGIRTVEFLEKKHAKREYDRAIREKGDDFSTRQTTAL